MEKETINNQKPSINIKHNVKRSIKVTSDEFLALLINGKKIIDKNIVDTLNEFGQVYYVSVKIGNIHRLLYCV